MRESISIVRFFECSDLKNKQEHRQRSNNVTAEQTFQLCRINTNGICSIAENNLKFTIRKHYNYFKISLKVIQFTPTNVFRMNVESLFSPQNTQLFKQQADKPKDKKGGEAGSLGTCVDVGCDAAYCSDNSNSWVTLRKSLQI